MRLNPEAIATLQALRGEVKIAPLAYGVWEGGRLYDCDDGKRRFIASGIKTSVAYSTDAWAEMNPKFVGDGVRNAKGWFNEMKVTNPVPVVAMAAP